MIRFTTWNKDGRRPVTTDYSDNIWEDICSVFQYYRENGTVRLMRVWYLDPQLQESVLLLNYDPMT